MADISPAVDAACAIGESNSSDQLHCERVEGGECDTPDIGLSILIGERIRAGTVNLYSEALMRMEKQLFSEVLQATDGNQSKAAALLGITRGKVRDRMLHFNIQITNSVRIAKSK
jgi:two-component system nitrogen regulation response regulator GlnG